MLYPLLLPNFHHNKSLFSFSGKVLQCDKSECLFSKIIKNTSFSLFCLRNRLLRFTHQTELGRKLGSPVKVPTSGIHIDRSRCVTGFSALINPFFIFVSHSPGGIRIHRLPFHINGGRSSLIQTLMFRLCLPAGRVIVSGIPN